MKQNETGVKALNKIKQAPDVREPWAAGDFMDSPAGDCMESPASDPMYPYISESWFC